VFLIVTGETPVPPASIVYDQRDVGITLIPQMRLGDTGPKANGFQEE
jgi:hypothetical protein